MASEQAHDPFKDWVETFKTEVENLTGPGAKTHPAAAPAQRGFDAWWQAAHEPVASAPPQADVLRSADPAPDAPQRAPQLPVPPEDMGSRVERLSAEKASLVDLTSRLSQEAEALRELREKAREEAAAQEARTSRLRETSEARTAALEAKVRELSEEVRSLREDKAFLEEAFRRIESSSQRLSGELSLEREKAEAATRSQLELRQRLSAQEEKLIKAREQAAFQAGALDELKRQSGLAQERTVLAKELTDAGVAGLRQEMRMLAEELKIMLRSMRSAPPGR